MTKESLIEFKSKCKIDNGMIMYIIVRYCNLTLNLKILLKVLVGVRVEPLLNLLSEN